MAKSNVAILPSTPAGMILDDLNQAYAAGNVNQIIVIATNQDDFECFAWTHMSVEQMQELLNKLVEGINEANEP